MLWYILYGTFVLCCIFALCVTAFVLVKAMNYSQQPAQIVDTKNYSFFTKDCIEVAKKCTKITVQSRVEESKTFMYEAAPGVKVPAFFIQTSNTDVFLGLIKDGKYLWTPKPSGVPVNYDPDVLCNNKVCTRLTCSRRIAKEDTECGKIRSDYFDCLKDNNNEMLNKCPGSK